jgi:hypothetical protein
MKLNYTQKSHLNYLATRSITTDLKHLASTVTTAINVPWLRQLVAGLSQQRPKFTPWSVHVQFVVYKVAMEQVYLQIFLFFPVKFIPL